MVASSCLVKAAEDGAKAAAKKQSNVMETYTLGVAAARSSTMKPRARAKILLPGKGDVVTAACFVLGGTTDMDMAAVLMRVSPSEPRDLRISVIDELLGRRVRAEVRSCNGDTEMKASSQICTRIFDVIADMILAFSTQKLLEYLFDLQQRELELQRKETVASAAAVTLRQRIKLAIASSDAKDATIRTLQAQLEIEQKERDEIRKLIPEKDTGDEITNASKDDTNLSNMCATEDTALHGATIQQPWIHSLLFPNTN